VGALSQLEGLRVVRALVALGWAVDRVNGSHHVLTAAGMATLSIPVHKGRTMKLGTIRGLLKAAGISEEQFLAAYCKK